MNHEQMQALGRVLEHFGHDDVKHYEEAGKPAGHIAEALLTLDKYRQARSLDKYYAAKVYRGDEAAESTPAGNSIGIVRDHPIDDEALSTEHDIIWMLLSLAKLPVAIENLVRDAVNQKMPVELRAPVVAVLKTINQERLDEEIPF